LHTSQTEVGKAGAVINQRTDSLHHVRTREYRYAGPKILTSMLKLTQ
jgi:hypothetical protein